MAATHYVGKAGHLAVMGEFAWRGYNVAMPEIDIGDDIFVYRDSTNQVWRVQVKASKPKAQIHSQSFQLRIREDQISKAANPPLYFVFALRQGVGWRFIVISQSVLRNYRNQGKFGTDATQGNTAMVQLTITLHHSGANSGKAFCSKHDITHLLDNFSDWPRI